MIAATDYLPIEIALIGAAATVVASAIAAVATRRTGRDNNVQHGKVQEHLLKLSEAAVSIQQDVGGLRKDVVGLQDDVRTLQLIVKPERHLHEVIQVP